MSHTLSAVTQIFEKLVNKNQLKLREFFMFVLSSHLLPCKPMNIENRKILSILTNNFGCKSMDYIYQPRLIYKFYIKQQETLRFFFCWLIHSIETRYLIQTSKLLIKSIDLYLKIGAHFP